MEIKVKEIIINGNKKKNIFYSGNLNDIIIDRSLNSKELTDILYFNQDIGMKTEGNVSKFKDKRGNTKHKITKMNYLPLLHKDWKDIVKTKNNKSFGISNYGLAIDKFSRFNGKNLDYIAYNGADNLYHLFNQIVDDKFLQYVREKQNKLIESFNGDYTTGQISIKQNRRLVLHLGSATAYNNGFLLHPVYGIPYLSETAIKGMLRSYVVENYFDFDEDKALKSPLFVCIFGEGNDQDKSIGKQGKVTFLPAFPVNDNFTIEADIMNPHNSKYYGSNKKYPSDKETPTPIKFITLKQAEFKPAFVIKNNETIKFSNDNKFDKEYNNKNLDEIVKDLLLKAFEIKGIGAKTNKAYGRLFPEDKLREKEKEIVEVQKEANDTKSNIENENNQTIEEYELEEGDYLGTVKFYNETKGYGFITERITGKDYYINKMGLCDNVIIKQGDFVIFSLYEGRKGEEADKVEIFDKNKHQKQQ